MYRKLLIGKMISILVVSLVLFVVAGYAEESQTDATGGWQYILQNGGATIAGAIEEPTGALLIPSELDGHTVTAIADSAFQYCFDVTDVAIPDGVTIIGDHAFAACISLTSVTIPGSVERIGGFAFSSCTDLTNVILSEGVQRIGDRAFMDCQMLTNVSIPASVMHIEGNPFARAHEELSSLEFIDVSLDNPWYEQIDGVLFDKKEKVLIAYPAGREGTYAIPKGTLRIGDEAFKECLGLTGVTVPGSVRDIGKRAFLRCGYLSRVSMQEGVLRIGDGAFEGCGSAIVTIPASVEHIGVNPFEPDDANYALASVSVSPDSLWYEEIAGVLFDKRRGMVVSCLISKEVEYTIPEGTRGIGERAFAGCSLSSVTIPEGVTSIGDGAFAWGLSLRGIAVPDSVTMIGKDAFGDREGLLFYTSEGSYAERYARDHGIDCVSSWWRYEIVDGSAVITGYLLALPDDLMIPDEVNGYAVTAVGDAAFSGCEGIISVTIPASVTRIGDAAFSGCKGISGVTLSEGVAWICDEAFSRCESITSVSIPASVMRIGDEAFSGCKGIRSVAFMEGVARIGDGAFSGCSDLTGVRLPASVTHIGAGPFAYCSALTDIDVAPGNPVYTQIGGVLFDKPLETLIAYPAGRKGAYEIPEGTLHIGDKAFFLCTGLTGVTLPDSVRRIGDNAFSDCKGLTGIAIPEGVRRIGDNAFSSCKGLTDVTIPGSVEHIGGRAFAYCDALTDVTILEGVQRIGDGAFTWCRGLTSIMLPASMSHIGLDPFPSSLTAIGVSPGNPVYEQIDGVLFDKQEQALIAYPCAREGTYEIPEGTLRIGDCAFRGCRGLTGILLPDCLESIGDQAFDSCPGLASAIIFLPASVYSIGQGAFHLGLQQEATVCVSEGSYAAQYAQENDLIWLYVEDVANARANEAIQWTYELADGGVTISGYEGKQHPTGDLLIPSEVAGYAVTGIGNGAFTKCISLTSVTIPGSVVYIGAGAFRECSNLVSVAIPEGVQRIGEGAFDRCTSLTNATIPSSVNHIDIRPFSLCSSLADIDVSPDNPFYAQVDGVLFDKQLKTLVSYPFAREGAYTIPEGVTVIGDMAFTWCKGLTDVTIPGSVTSIGEWAFASCDGLTHMVLPNSVERIGESAFGHCMNLSSVTLPDDVKHIGDWVFSSCPNLNSVTLPVSVDRIPDRAFSSSGMANMTIPGSVTSIGRLAFYYTDLTSLVIPDSVTNIGEMAFSTCSSLTIMTIPASVTSIGKDAFAECEQLTLRVTSGSFAERYAKEYEIPYVLATE